MALPDSIPVAPENQVSFTVSITGSDTGKNYSGRFSFKLRLSPRNLLRMDELRREMLGSQSVDASIGADARMISTIFSEMQTRQVKAPTWWTEFGNGLDIEDDLNVPVEVFNTMTAKLAEARGKVQEETEEARAAANIERKRLEDLDEPGAGVPVGPAAGSSA